MAASDGTPAVASRAGVPNYASWGGRVEAVARVTCRIAARGWTAFSTSLPCDRTNGQVADTRRTGAELIWYTVGRPPEHWASGGTLTSHNDSSTTQRAEAVHDRNDQNAAR